MSNFTRDNTAWLALARAKNAARAQQPKSSSWWADPNLSRAEFQQRVKLRHRDILNSTSDFVRSLSKAI